MSLSVDSSQALSLRMEAYILQLSDIYQRWMAWLTATELLSIDATPETVGQLQERGLSLITELRDALEGREQILDSAQQAGWTATTLRSLAESLPAWKRPRFRAAFDASRQQLAQLRRLHTATWVYLNESANFYNDLTRLISGTVAQHVYMDDRPRECGGHLLDACL
ncbi:MAG: hypothetical protein KF752_07045 [Pirellulaceae bacterium]|nr:hypothetical protein [Pirellulaceae bacterium]